MLSCYISKNLTIKLLYRYNMVLIPLIFHFICKGDCKSCIHLWEPASDTTWNVDPNPFIGHSASVEDLQVNILYVKRYLNFLGFFKNIWIQVRHECLPSIAQCFNWFSPTYLNVVEPHRIRCFCLMFCGWTHSNLGYTCREVSLNIF